MAGGSFGGSSTLLVRERLQNAGVSRAADKMVLGRFEVECATSPFTRLVTSSRVNRDKGMLLFKFI